MKFPASVSMPTTSTTNVSVILGQKQAAASAAASGHHAFPTAASLPPPGLGTAATGVVTRGQLGFYKPYREHDFPHFRGTMEEYGGWKQEWTTKDLPEDVPGATEEIQLGQLENIILKLYKQLSEVEELHQLTENPAAVKKIV